mgnify:CR=1 FL=1
MMPAKRLFKIHHGFYDYLFNVIMMIIAVLYCTRMHADIWNLSMTMFVMMF